MDGLQVKKRGRHLGYAWLLSPAQEEEIQTVMAIIPQIKLGFRIHCGAEEQFNA